MNFADEEYVRLYIRDTDTWRALKFEGQAVLALMLRRFDGSGVYKFGKRSPARSVAAAIGCDEEFAAKGLKAILEEEIWEQLADRFFWPKWEEGQYCNRSDKLRKRMERARKAALEAEQNHSSVTSCHENGRVVTDCPPKRTSVTPRRGEGEARQGEDPEESPERNRTAPRPKDPMGDSLLALDPAEQELFEAYRNESGKTGVRFDDNRRYFQECVRAGVTVEQVKTIVIGAKKEKYAVDNGLVPSLLLGSSGQREKYLCLARASPAKPRRDPPQPNDETNRYQPRTL